jgi:hypothetical protein
MAVFTYLDIFGLQRPTYESFINNEIKVPHNTPEDPDGGSGIAPLSLDLDDRRGWVVSTTSRPVYLRERSSTHCTGGWEGPRAGLDVYEKSRVHRDSIPGPSST